jgi:hypothetical protein
MIPLVLPALFAGAGAATIRAVGRVGGQAGFPVTLMDKMQPALFIRHAPAGIGLLAAALLARFPTLKKIQSLATPDPPPLGLKNSVTGEHASPVALAKPVPAGQVVVPTPLRMPVAAAKLS